MKSKLTTLLSSILLIIVCSCKKTAPTPERVPLSEKLANTNVGILAVPIPTYPLDWENIAFMPTPSGATVIPVPWASGAGRQISPEVVNDYKKNDGWVLLYNTFTTTVQSDELYFILYNKYRGVIKMYYYIPPTANFIESANIVHKLGIEGSYANASTSPMMKFAASAVVDYDAKVNQASILEQWQVAPKTWYAFEYELAYDANMANQNFGTCNFIWPVTSNNVTKVILNGKLDGTVRGSMSVPGFDLTVSPSFNTSSTGDGNIIIKGDSDVEKIKPSITTQLFNTLKGLVTKNITSGLGGIVENLFSGIFGGKSDASTENVNLKIDANIEMEGSLTSNFLIGSTALSIPGYNQSNTTGFVPAYNSPLGVFYISNKPTVNETTQIHTRYDENGMEIDAQYIYQYSGVDNSYEIIVNPAVLAIANIQNITKQVITADASNLIAGIRETIGVTGASTSYNGVPSNVIGIRIAFDVVPHDGSPKVKIVKSFSANVSYSTEYF
ncbi:MAG TPA: hypothetical protein VN040_10205 [Pseudosphingobacterium sp.]|nr:hypothetical protein [Pseudosphingobacterium sp.]